MNTLLLLFVALIADRRWGEPEVLWSRFPHPVVLFGKAIRFADQSFNLESDSDALRYRKGAMVSAVLILASLLAGLALEWLFARAGLLGHVFEAFVVFVLLAQKSLLDHVGAVASALLKGGLEEGRRAVSMIVGRDPSLLDRSGVSRAAIETLGENFSDGVVAPAFWYAVFGLPGIITYKMINTADSMIGYKNDRHLHFGRVSAQVDDLANWLPARLSAVLIAGGALLARGRNSGRAALRSAFQDAGLHRSPNAGWPEAALAGACNFALGGPRLYATESVAQSHLNASGKTRLDGADIDEALRVVDMSGHLFAGLIAVLWLVSLVFC